VAIPSVTPPKYYVYDAATVDSASMAYAKGRLAEAYTGTSKTTDLGFSYSNRGEAATVYQSSPHSGGYYHIAASYWAPQGLLDTINPNMTGIPTWTYTPEGEGRANTVSASAGQNPVTATSYNGFSEVTGITFGSADSDAFTYDPKTGRMTQYKASVNGSAMTGALTWNANWTLGTLGITDALNSADTQNCTYAYDNLSRLTSAGCGSVWSQSFTYDAFGNIKKSGSQSFQPTYSATTNQMTNTGAVTPTYDTNGNLTYDGFYNYTWDGEGNLATLNSNGETYDALNRRVEQYNGSAYTEIVYGPAGNKMALMSGQTVTKVFAPLSAGATAVYTSSGLSYYRHPDWLGSSRVASTTSRTLYYDGAYAPFGENYAETGTTDRNFTGQNQDLTPGSTGLLYDFPHREQHSTEGRWISPDPAGINAAAPTNPQSWNRYAYVLNNPLNAVDPLGLFLAQLCDDQGNCYFVDTDALGAAGFNIQTDENGNITGITGPGVNVTLVDSNGNVVGTINAESTFTLTTVTGAQSVTVSAQGTAVATVGALTLGGGATYIGPFAATPAQRAIFSQAYQKAAPVTNACFWGALTVAAAGTGAVGAAAANGEEIVTAVQANYPSLYTNALNWLYLRGASPGYPGSLGVALGAARQAGQRINSACSQMQ
jgi:RHS repeat-associated protein